MRDWFTKDFYWKAFSLLMAIGIWLTVRKEAETSAGHSPAALLITYKNLPIIPVSDNTDVRLAQLVPHTVNATISGASDVMNTLQGSQIHVFVNLTGLSSAQNLTRNVEISLPNGATVVDIDPPVVVVTLQKQP